MQDGVHRSNVYAGIGSYLFHSQAAVFHKHLFHSRNHVFRSASAWPRLLRFVFTRRSAFFELSYPRTHIFHVHNAIIACLTQLLMDFDGEWRNQIITCCSSNVNVAISVSKTLLSLDDVTSIQRVGQCCHYASPNLKNSHVFSQLSRFYLLPFPRKKLGDLRT